MLVGSFENLENIVLKMVISILLLGKRIDVFKE